MMREGMHTDHERVGEFGPATSRGLPYRSINVLQQIRSGFDQEKLDELADSIQYQGDGVDGRRRYDLMQPPSVGVHTPESALSYLEQLNTAWGTNYTLDDLTSWESDEGRRYIILIAGERRYRSVGLKIHQDSLSADSCLVCAVEENPTFIEAFPRQFVENNARVNPSPQDEARAIRAYFDMMQRISVDEHGEPVHFTQKMCAEAFSISPDKVHKALVFTDYPECMQKLIERWSYNSLIAAKEIYGLYRKYYHEQHAGDGTAYTSSDGSLHFTDAESVAAYEVETCLLRLKAELLRRRVNPNGARFDLSLPAQAIKISEGFEQEQFTLGISGVVGFEEVDDMKSRRHRATHGLFSPAYGAIELLDKINGLTDDMRLKLGGLAITHEMLRMVDDEVFESALVEAVA